MATKAANHYVPAGSDRALWDRVNWLIEQATRLEAQLAEVRQGAAGGGEVAELRVQIQAVTDRLTGQSTFVGAQGTNFTQVGAQVVAGGGSGFAVSGTTSAVVFTVSSQPAARTALGLGTVATKDIAGAVPDSAVVAAVGYVQADFQSVIDTLNALLGSLRVAGHIAP